MIVLNRRHTLSLFASSLLTGCAGLGGGHRPVVALLLPQTGDSAGLAEAMRDAAVPAGFNDKSAFEIQVFDTGDTAATAAAAAARAISARASLILGPVFARQVQSTVAAAGAIPIITFSNESDLVGSGAFIFGITPAQSITAIFAFARAQGVKRISVIASDHAWGLESIEAAKALGPRAGLILNDTIILKSEDDIAQLQTRLRRAGTTDAVLIADGGPRLPSVAQSVAATGLQILGTSQWIGDDLSSISALRGAWFAGPDTTGSLGNTRHRKGLLPLLAHDGVTIAAALVAAGGVSRVALLNTNGFPTSLGHVRFLLDGSIERDLAILGINAEGVHVLSKAAA